MSMGSYTLLPVVFVVVAAMAFFAATTSAELDPQLPIQGGYDVSWPCCDSCGLCTWTIPPRCTCDDLVPTCHPSCKLCVESPDNFDPPRYQCKDVIPSFCKRRCTPKLDTLPVE